MFKNYCETIPDPVEGYVVRLEGEIYYGSFRKSTAKWVREKHVNTSKFWMSEPVIPNIIIES